MNRVGLYQFKKYRIMNKTYKSGMMALSAVVFFISCSESESLQQAHLSTDQINFIASMAHQWDANTKSAPQNPSSRSAGVRDNEAPIHVNANLAKPLYLHPVVQDGIHIWSKQGTPITRSGAPIEDVEQERVVQTRGKQNNNLSDYTSFNVSAVNTHDNPESLFFGYQKAASVTSNSTTTWHVSDGIKCWPEAPATLSFYAYAPDNSMVTVESGDDAAGVKTVHYKATTPVTDQPDLIVSSAAESRPSNAKPTAVNLPFYHALTAVTFSVDAAMMPGTLTKVELVNVNTEGDCTMTASATPSFSWSNQTTPSTFSFDFNQPVGSSAVTLTSGEKTLMMVPQELPADAKVNFTFTVNGVSQTLSAPIGGKGKTWEAGKSIIYKLSTNAVSTISATSVSFPTTWNDIAVTSATDKVSYPKSTFDNGERIGLYVVDEDGKLVGSNIKLTKNTDGWKLDGNDKFMLLTRYKYFAYYPYSTTAPAVTASADNAADFFASKISSLSPVSDQSAQNILLAQDFQVAKGAFGPDGASLKLDMAHQVGLAVLNLTSKKVADTRRFKDDTYRYYYGLDNTVPTTSNYTDTGSKELMASSNFEGNKPYNVSGTKYLQVIPLNKATSFMAADQDGHPRTAWGKLSTTKQRCSIEPATSAPKLINIQTDADFYYLARVYTCTQSVEEFTAPVAGEYKLQCWGASGHSVFGEDTALPGLGGYAASTYQMQANHIIYICAGGYANGYNNKCDYTGSGLGGGATSITIEIGAELKELSNKQDNKDKVLLVAGGGGGIERSGKAGSGGGLKGLDGVSTFGEIQAYGTGGTQNAGGLNNQGNAYPIYLEYKACFGAGGIAARNTGTSTNPRMDFGAQGGGGWYGGGGTGFAGAAGGGSSYGKTSSLVKDSFVTIDGDHEMPSPYGEKETGHSGDGACVISWFLKQ